MVNKVYTVIHDGDKLKCYDTQSGSIAGYYAFEGDVINGPIVTGDRVTVVLRTSSGKTGRIFSLPSFGSVSSFNVA
jgi:hypothetical protein